MDAWSQDQLKKMQLGGNDKMNDFFGKYGISKNTDIKEKYNSTAAEVCSHVRLHSSRHIGQDPSDPCRDDSN